MRFERGGDIKRKLRIGIPTYSIYRMSEFRGSMHDNDPGFYILAPAQIRRTLKKLEKGELSRAGFSIEFSRQYEELENKAEMNLYELHTCMLQYEGQKYLIKSHIDYELRKR